MPGISNPRGQNDSHLSHHDTSSFADDDAQNGSAAAAINGEHSSNGFITSPSRPETSAYIGTSLRTPARSFHHRSYHGALGMDPASIV